MKLITFYSKSHECLVRRLLNSCIGEFDVKVHEIPQRGTGYFRSPGYRETMVDKLKIIREEATEDFIFADADIVFLRPSLKIILEEMSSFDILFQNDGPHRPFCAGLFVMKINEGTLRFLDTWISKSEFKLTGPNEFGYDEDDQDVLNGGIIQTSKLSYGKLSLRFTNPCHLMGNHNLPLWDGRKLDFPSEILVFHANWTEGIENKIKLMDMAMASV